MNRVIASKRLGIQGGHALMADGMAVRFRVISRNPFMVGAVGVNAELGDAKAIEAWFAAQREA